MIDTTINFTQGLALTINAPDQGFQIIEAIFLPNNGAGGEVQAYSQLSLGDQLNTGIRGQLRRLYYFAKKTISHQPHIAHTSP